ncbi:MAG: hypothetical protein HY236_09540 [Acidobacteria bacterium]|nr:hypothetical protein [Acidobacteriota bacterium]
MRMLWMCLLAAPLWAQQPPPEAPPPEVPLSGVEIEHQHLRQLLSLRRVYVDRLSGGDSAAQVRDMIIAALQRARLFIVTEDESRADAYLRGSAEDLVFTETRSSREGINARASSRISNSRSRYDGDSAAAALGVGESEDSYSKERKHEAVAALRLVSRDGDVLWSATQESLGAKYKGSSADVAEKLAKELAAAYARARRLASQPAGPNSALAGPGRNLRRNRDTGPALRPGCGGQHRAAHRARAREDPPLRNSCHSVARLRAC